MDDEAGSNELKSTGYEIFVGVLSILSVLNLVLMFAIDDESLSTVLLAMNGLLSMVFLGDFAYRLFTAGSKRHYFLREFGWADLLASLPFQQVKILRLFRVMRVLRLLRQYGLKSIARSLLKDRAGSALFTLLLMGIFVLEFGSLWILHIERGQDGANIDSASDAIWYTLVTISTVGYGDRFPVTNHGRLVGAFIIVIGVGIFGTFTGYLANLFLGAPKDEPEPEPTQGEMPDVAPAGPDPELDVAAKVAELKAMIAEQRRALEELERLVGSSPPN